MQLRNNNTSSPITKPKAIIFDWDNTLVDCWKLMQESINHTFRTFGMKEWTLNDIKTNFHKSAKDSLPKYFPHNYKEAEDIYRNHYQSISKLLKPIKASKLVLDLLKRNNIHTSVISNKLGSLLRNEIQIQFQWDHYFEFIIGSKDLPTDKPSPAGILKIQNHLEVSPDDIWMIGDSVTDMETAHNAKCIPILFGDSNPEDLKYNECKPRLYFNDHETLYKFISNLLPIK